MAGELMDGEMSAICGFVHLLFIVSGKPVTAEGRKRLNDHINECRSCSRSGSFQGDLLACIELTPELQKELEKAFGPCDFLP